MSYALRDFNTADTVSVNALAVAAFEQFRNEYSDWEDISRRVGNMASLAKCGELIVACNRDRIVGAVVYIGPHEPKSEIFSVEWPILRMLVVEPRFRGMGVGSALTEECIKRAVRDKAPLIALHSSRIMKVALSMYERMGFQLKWETPLICGVPYGVYVLDL